MQYNNDRIKRGFTLTELAITLAVIVILVCVLVPVFIKIISDARLSNDKALVKNLNTTLSANEAVYGKPEDVIIAVNILFADGYDIDDLVLESNNNLVYNSKTNRLSIYDSSFVEPIYGEEQSGSGTESQLSVIGVDNAEAALKADIDSFYLYTNNEYIEVELSACFDLWLCTEAEEAQLIAPNAVVYYYGIIKTNSKTKAIHKLPEGTEDEQSSADPAEPVEHTHTYGEWIVEKEATCTEDGIERRYCSGCDSYEEQSVAKKEHEFGGWEIVKAATCTEEGTESRVCKNCGYSVEQDIDATGHNYTVTEVPKTVDNRAYELSECSLCGYSCNEEEYGEYLYSEELEFECCNNEYYIVKGILDSQKGNVKEYIYIPSYYRESENDEFLPVTEIAEDAFSSNTVIKTVTIGNKIETIGANAFYGCSSLTKVNIPGNLKTFGEKCFCSCVSLKVIYYSAINANDTDGYVFGKAGLESDELIVYISPDVQRIPENLFYNAGESGYRAYITAIIFEEGSECSEIGTCAFGYLEKLEYVVLPLSVETVGITIITMGKSTSKIDVYFTGETKTEWENSVYYGQNFVKKYVSNIYYYSETEAIGYWHYVDGVPELWKAEVD